MNHVRAESEMATVAHELNNVLAVIGGHTELLLDEVGDASPLHGDLEAIGRAVHRASALVDRLVAANGNED